MYLLFSMAINPGSIVVQEGKKTVVRTNKKVSIFTEDNGLSIAPDRGVDNGNVDGSLLEIAVILFDEEGPFPHILGINLVGDVHNSHIRIGREDNSLHNPNVRVFGAKISEEGDCFQGFMKRAS